MPVTEPKFMVKDGLDTRTMETNAGLLSESDLSFCLKVLSRSGVLILPTDTVYGIVCNAFDPVAIGKVYALKGRDYAKPLPVLLHAPDQLSLVACEMPAEVSKLTSQFWPGPLTLVLKTAPMALSAVRGRDTIAVRVPDHGVVCQILERANIPLAATSANISGEKSCESGKDVIDKFQKKVDVIVDDGKCLLGKESSVVDVTHYPFTVLRQGVVSKRELTEKLNL